MPFFRAKPRSWDAYMVGIGASGAMMASAVVLFVILIGIVTFKTWPHTGSLLGIGGGGNVALQDPAAPAPGHSSQGSSTINVSSLLGGGAQVSPRQTVGHGGGGGIENGPVSGGEGGLPGGSGGSPPGQSLGAQPPAPPSTSSPNVVGQAVSGVGSTVQHTTENLGNTVNNATGTSLGNEVTDLGSTLDQNLQALAGNH